MKIPCKDCLILAMCKSQLKDTPHAGVVFDLVPKCSILQEYIYGNSSSWKTPNIKEIVEFFNI